MESFNIDSYLTSPNCNDYFDEEVSISNLEPAPSPKKQEAEKVDEDKDQLAYTAALVAEVEKIVAHVTRPPIAPEDEYIAPGRRKYDRDSLAGFEEELVKTGPPILHNGELCRQNYALRDFAYTLANTVKMNDINSKDTPVNLLKPAI